MPRFLMRRVISSLGELFDRGLSNPEMPAINVVSEGIARPKLQCFKVAASRALWFVLIESCLLWHARRECRLTRPHRGARRLPSC